MVMYWDVGELSYSWWRGVAEFRRVRFRARICQRDLGQAVLRGQRIYIEMVGDIVGMVSQPPLVNLTTRLKYKRI